MRVDLVSVLRRHRVLLLIAVDTVAWVVALAIAAGLRLSTGSVDVRLRFDGADVVPLIGILVLGVVAASAHIVLAWVVRLHNGRHATGGFEEFAMLSWTIAVVGGIVTMVNFFAGPLVPRTVPLIAAALAFFLASWPRALWRVVVTQASRRTPGAKTVPVVIAGAGEGGRELVRVMLNDPEHRWHPVAFVDDDPRKRHFRYRGVGVRGSTAELVRVAERWLATTVVIAMPSAPSKAIGRIYEIAREGELDVKVLPPMSELLDGVSVATVRDIAPEDLLGRHEVSTDVGEIADYLTGMRVLVTGAGGSIGSELCRQIKRFDPASLVMVDRDESALHSLLLSIDHRADLESPDMVLADIRDLQRMREVFAEHRPHVVFHAAALKHVNMLEGQPSEAVKTNVQGTLNVLRAAEGARVEKFVNISTDKAADPENVLGYTKRLAEGLTAAMGATARGTYMSVRFGNVLGTRGSVLTTFADQIAAGGPVTVTDPEVSRYFMTVGEAVQLVIQAAAIGGDGEALVLDMGEPVRILDVAEQMIELSGADIGIEIIGLKPGEKLHEALFGDAEVDLRPKHPLISHVDVPKVSATVVDRLLVVPEAGASRQVLAKSCSEMGKPRVGAVIEAARAAVR